jgi:hypothetical protein
MMFCQNNNQHNDKKVYVNDKFVICKSPFKLSPLYSTKSEIQPIDTTIITPDLLPSLTTTASMYLSGNRDIPEKNTVDFENIRQGNQSIIII